MESYVHHTSRLYRGMPKELLKRGWPGICGKMSLATVVERRDTKYDVKNMKASTGGERTEVVMMRWDYCTEMFDPDIEAHFIFLMEC